ASFIVSPTLNTKTLEICGRYGIEHIPGVLTPTEILTAYEHGARMVKIFPADVVGPKYVRNIRGPLPQITAMVTGGITFENMQNYLKEGSNAVGIGSNLVNAHVLQTDKNYQLQIKSAKKYIHITQQN